MPTVKTKISSFSQTEIKKLFKKAKIRVRTCGLRIFTASQSGIHGRILIVTPRKSGIAPERNLFRRRIKGIFREHGFPEKGTDFIVIIDKQATKLSFAQLEKYLLMAFNSHKD